MNKLLFASLLALAGGGALACPVGTIAQGVDSTGQPICVGPNTGSSGTDTPHPQQPGSGQTSYTGPVGTPSPYPSPTCMSNLAGFASEKLRAQLLKDKAVTAQVMKDAKIGESQLGASCAKFCTDYDMVSSKIHWAKMSPGFLNEPERSLQSYYKQLAHPLPGKAELEKCLPQQVTMNWCPPSGSGVGAGPSRIENPIDKIKVCATGYDALKNMNFTEADAAHNCARPSIVDAAERIKAEHACVTQVAQAKDTADKAAASASANAQSPNASMGLAPGARKKP